MLQKLMTILIVAMVCWIAAPAYATYTVYGSGTGDGGQTISASADFDFVTHDFGSGGVSALLITLTNTEPVSTTYYRANLLTGLFFSFDPAQFGGTAPTLTTTSAGFDGLAPTLLDTKGGATTTNVDIAPAGTAPANTLAYKLSNGTFGTSNGVNFSPYAYGITTVGGTFGGTPGFSGVDGDNYGIAPAGASLTSDGMPAVGKVIDTLAYFYIKLDTTNLNLNTLITNARLNFGSLPNYSTVAVSIPEPSTLFLLGAGISCLAILRRKSNKP